MEEENRNVVEEPTPVQPSAPAPTPAPKSSNPLIWIIGLILLVAVGAGAWYAGQKFADNEDEEKTSSKKKDKEKDEEKDEEDEKEKEKEKEKENKKTPANKIIACNGEESGIVISMEFDYNTSKKTVTGGGMDMKMDMKEMAKSMGTELTDEQYEAMLKEVDASEMCGDLKAEDGYRNCKASMTNGVLNAHVDFDIDTLLDGLTDKEKEFEPEELADKLEDEMGEFGVTCRVK